MQFARNIGQEEPNLPYTNPSRHLQRHQDRDQPPGLDIDFPMQIFFGGQMLFTHWVNT